MGRRAGTIALVALALVVVFPMPAAAAGSKPSSHDNSRVRSTPHAGASTPTTPPAVATVPTSPPDPPASYADPLASLGAGSPACHADVTVQARRNCRATGAVEHAHPLSSYGFDVQVGFSVAHLQDSFLGALQNIAALIWMALVYLLKGVMLLLEWGFSIDLLGEAMNDVRHTLTVLHEQVIGQPWFLAALAVTALWGIWHGLVQRRTTQTLGALAATAGLMICALVVLARPDETVGYASRLANEASVGVLAAATGHDVQRPDRALSSAMIGVFDSTVRDPWCALEFGSVDYCQAAAAGGSGRTNADVWLTYPAGSGERRSLYKLLKGEKLDTNGGLLNKITQPVTSVIGIGGGKDATLPDRVKSEVAKDPGRAGMQDAGGTVPRFALLALIGVGMAGAIGLLTYLGVRLLLAAIMALILLLLTPAVLLAPAFGASGRATFIAWSRRLVGALAAKLVYSLFLAVVLAAAATLRGVGIGWFGAWLLQIAFWWGVLIKRKELIGFVSAAAPVSHGEHSAGALLSKGYYATQLGRSTQRVLGTVGGPPRAATAQLGQVARDRGAARQAATQLAGEQLDTHAATVLASRETRARETVARTQSHERELRALDRHLAGHDEARAAARAQGLPEPAPNEQQAAMLTRRRELQAEIAAPESRAAQHVVLRAERALAEHGSSVAPADVRAYRQARERHLRSGQFQADDPRHAEAAGLSSAALSAASVPERPALLEQVREHVQQERQLQQTASDGRGRREVRLDPQALRTRSADERERIRQERQERRTRANIFRGA